MRVRLASRDAPDGACYTSLTLGGEYEVLGLTSDTLRLLNDRGEPVLYYSVCFEIIDATEPENWVSVIVDGVRYANPPGWGEPGFFEDWHDAVPEVRRQFAEDLAKWHPRLVPHG